MLNSGFILMVGSPIEAVQNTRGSFETMLTVRSSAIYMLPAIHSLRRMHPRKTGNLPSLSLHRHNQHPGTIHLSTGALIAL